MAPAAPVGKVPRQQAAGQPGDRKRARDDPDLQGIAAAERAGDVAARAALRRPRAGRGRSRRRSPRTRWAGVRRTANAVMPESIPGTAISAILVVPRPVGKLGEERTPGGRGLRGENPDKGQRWLAQLWGRLWGDPRTIKGSTGTPLRAPRVQGAGAQAPLVCDPGAGVRVHLVLRLHRPRGLRPDFMGERLIDGFTVGYA